MQILRDNLIELGYETYGEVISKYNKKRCDMFAYDKELNIYLAFEGKLNYNLTVLSQAQYWKDKSHKIYVVIQSPKRRNSTYSFFVKLCKLLEMGLIVINCKTKTITFETHPTLVHNPKLPDLNDYQKLTVASNENNQYITPFKITCFNIDEYMNNLDPSIKSLPLKELIKNIKHHYKSDRSAYTSLSRLMYAEIIKKYKITKIKNALWISKI